MWQTDSTFLDSSHLLRAFIDTAIVLSMFMLSFIFVILFYLVEVNLLFVYIYIAFWNTIIKREESWGAIIRFNSTTLLYLSLNMTLISIGICCGLFLFNDKLKNTKMGFQSPTSW